MSELVQTTTDPDDLAQALAVSILLMRQGLELDVTDDQRIGMDAQGFYFLVRLPNGEWRYLPTPTLTPRDLLARARKHPRMLVLARMVTGAAHDLVTANDSNTSEA